MQIPRCVVLLTSKVETAYRLALGVQRQEIAMGMMFHALDVTLRLTHPFMPFLTEGLWQELDPRSRAEVDGASIMLSPFPTIHNFPEIELSETEPMKLVLELVETMRRYGVYHASADGVRKLVAILPPADGNLTGYLRGKMETLSMISRVEVVDILDEAQRKSIMDGQTGSGGGWGVCLQLVDKPVGEAVEKRPVFVYA